MAANRLVLDFNTTNVQAALRGFRTRYPKAIARALNRSIVSSRALMITRVSKDMGLKAADVRKEMVLREARPDKLTAALEIRGNRIPLIKFSAKGPEPSRGRGKGVRAKLPGGAQRYPHAFIATMKSGHRGVFQRVPGARRHGAGATRPQLPIYQLHGPSLPKVFYKHIDAGLERGQQSLVTNLRSELRFAMSQKAA